MRVGHWVGGDMALICLTCSHNACDLKKDILARNIDNQSEPEEDQRW